MRLITNLFLVFVLMSSTIVTANGPNDPSTVTNEENIQALNNYVDFINEGTHGMLIVVKLLENFNLDINQYVDLASYKINNYNNDDLPKDIFQDREHWFYDVSPYELYAKCLAGGKGLSGKASLDQKASELKSILSNINQIRFDLESLIKNNDLKVKENLTKVYKKLEEGVNWYEEFYETQKELENLIYAEAQLNNGDLGSTSNIYKELKILYETSRDLLLKLREKEVTHYDQVLKLQSRAVKEVAQLLLPSTSNYQSSKFKFNWDNIVTSAGNLNSSFSGFEKGSASEQYKIYGKYYYYYNVFCISKFNRYGTGIVSGINNVITYLKMPRVKFTELPHYFKVIYPQKLEKVDYVESTNKNIKAVPKELKERKVSTGNKQIRVTDDVVEFLFYDHMIADGDVASVSFNGDWIMEKEELELAPKRFKLKLNSEGRNYLLLHADNIGQRPPCTIGISYMMGGSKKEIILSSDLEVSEMIELVKVE